MASATDRLASAVLAAVVLAVALGAIGCGDDDEECPRTARFVVRNDTTQDLRVTVPAVTPDSSVTVAVGDSVEIARATGELPGGYPDLRDLMACLTVWSVPGDTLAFRLGAPAAADAWMLDEPDPCAGTFVLALGDSSLGRDDGADDCDETSVPRDFRRGRR